jgi:hypothetical protein
VKDRLQKRNWTKRQNSATEHSLQKRTPDKLNDLSSGKELLPPNRHSTGLLIVVPVHKSVNKSIGNDSVQKEGHSGQDVDKGQRNDNNMVLQMKVNIRQ